MKSMSAHCAPEAGHPECQVMDTNKGRSRQFLGRTPPLSLALSERLEEGQKLVRRTITTHADLERLCFRKCLFFEFEIGMKVNLRGVHGLVSQPQRDY